MTGTGKMTGTAAWLIFINSSNSLDSSSLYQFFVSHKKIRCTIRWTTTLNGDSPYFCPILNLQCFHLTHKKGLKTKREFEKIRRVMILFMCQLFSNTRKVFYVNIRQCGLLYVCLSFATNFNAWGKIKRAFSCSILVMNSYLVLKRSQNPNLIIT